MTTLLPAPVHFQLVDDLEENLVALQALLRRDGLVLLKARSGPEALELLLKHEVALALIDVQMPDMDGFELAELMRGTERTRRVPIIFLTAGNADRQRRFRGYEAGAVDFLHKPIEPDILKSKAEVFFELYCQRQEVIRQRDELKLATQQNARLLEESRQYAAALREADRRKDEFLAMLAHELRNPLAPIRHAMHMVRTRGQERRAINRQAYDIIERQVEHLVRLVDDLLDVSRITRGKIQLHKERVDLSTIVARAVEGSRPLIDARRHTLEVALPEGPLPVEGDPLRLAQVFWNLLNNAAKYTPEGGHISFVVERESAAKGAGKAVARVRDTGMGIPAEMLSRIFDLFTQIDRTMDRAEGGLGIGLTLVRTLTEMHGGKAEAFSAGPGQGSEFTVRLPLLAPEAPEATPTPNARHDEDLTPIAGQRILVVDDNRDSADSLATLLRLFGNEVHVAYDGQQALEAAASFQPKILLLDIGLPGMNGLHVCRQVRQLPGQEKSFIVAMTGYGQEDDRRRSHEAGFDAHLVKPVDLETLKELLSDNSRV